MTKDFKSGNVKQLPVKNVNLPNFKFSKKKRPEKNQNIATLILPLSSYSNPTPPHVA